MQELALKYLDQAAAASGEGARAVPLYEFWRGLTFEVICRVVVGLQLDEKQLQARHTHCL